MLSFFYNNLFSSTDFSSLWREAEKIRTSSLHGLVNRIIADVKQKSSYSSQVIYSNEFFQSILEMFDTLLLPIIDSDISKQLAVRDAVNDMDSIRKLLQYYKNCAKIASNTTCCNFSYDIGELYYQYLQQQHPIFIDKIETIATNVTNFICETLRRVANDQNIIGKAFVSGYQENNQLKITNIDFTGSDFHMRNRQVLLIEVEDTNGNSGKFVYKPFNLSADIFLVGNISRLTELDLRLTRDLDESISELLNKSITLKPNYPTYLIIPRVDTDTKNAFNSVSDEAIGYTDRIEHGCEKDYGYIEFLSHQPWMSKQQLKQKIFDEIESVSSQVSAYRSEEICVNTLEKILSKLTEEQKSNCDYLVSSTEQASNYWYICGLLSALFYIFGVGDMHAENIIISKQQPYPIDLEASFDASIMSMKTLDCFRDLGGVSGFSDRSTGKLEIKFLTGIRRADFIEQTLQVVEKNRLHMQHEGRITACPLDITAITNGFQNGLFYLNMNREALIMKLEHEFVDSMYFRALPLSTNTLNMFIKSADQLPVDKIRAIELDHNISVAKNTPAIDRDTVRSPTLSLLCADSVFLESIKTYNIPKFFFKFNSPYLFNNNGTMLTYTAEEITRIERENLAVTTGLNTHCYYQDGQTPKQKVLTILNNQLTHGTIIELSQQLIEKLESEIYSHENSNMLQSRLLNRLTT